MSIIMTQLKYESGKVNPHYDSPRRVIDGSKTETRRNLNKGDKLITRYVAKIKAETQCLVTESGHLKYYVGQERVIKWKRSSPAVWYRYVGEDLQLAHEKEWNKTGKTFLESAQNRRKDYSKFLELFYFQPARIRITGLEIQNLHEITRHQAQCEGISLDRVDPDPRKTCYYDYLDEVFYLHDPRWSYRTLFERINSVGSWDANPEIVRICFEFIGVVKS